MQTLKRIKLKSLLLLLPVLAVALLPACANVSKPQIEQVVVKIKPELPAKPLRLTPEPPEPYSLTAQKNINQWLKPPIVKDATPAK